MTSPDSAICTLFEGHHHYGVAGLINSLYKNGFRGDFFAGYKGDLPFWTTGLSDQLDKYWEGAKTMQIKNDLKIHFLPLDTNWHLTHYKPFFMLALEKKFPEQVKSIFYFDPDITIKSEWTFFERWIQHGVALVHEIAAVYMPPTHPTRKEWNVLINKAGLAIQHSLYSGINAGFCGIAGSDFSFLKMWSNIITAAIDYYGINPKIFAQTENNHLFHFADQDALNIAAMCYEGQISEMGPDAMDFVPNGWKVMSHATGLSKPWKKKFILSAIKGVSPSRPDQAYWFIDGGIIKTHTNSLVRLKRASIKISSFIARFYKKS